MNVSEFYEMKLMNYTKENDIYKMSKYINKLNKLLDIKKGGDYYKYPYYDKNKKVLDYITIEQFNEEKDRYLYIGDKSLMKLGNRNRQNIIKTITKNGLDKIYHISLNKLNDLKDTFEESTSWLSSNIYHNPRGLWVSCGIDWQNHIISPYEQWSHYTYLYEINLNDSILKINNLKEFKNFIKKYKNK